MPSARPILIVNSRSVHQPVFVVGAPHSGADLIGRALKASKGFHVTIGQLSVLRVVYARSEEHTSELQSLRHLVCRLLLEKTLYPAIFFFYCGPFNSIPRSIPTAPVC